MAKRKTRTEPNHAISNAKAWFTSIEEMLAKLETTDNAAREEAKETIHESVLSVMVRDGWHQPGAVSEDGPEEYEILLSTGGPALRIYGRLGQYNEPDTAEMQWQDWGTQWTRHEAPEATLLHFAQQFYFGD